MIPRLILLSLLPFIASAQSFFTYVGQIESRSVLIAWGTTARVGNTIGRTSSSAGPAKLRIGDRTIDTEQNWAIVKDLKPDTEYPYEVLINDKRMDGGTVRTYPEKANKLCFFVLGDYGTGTSGQYRVAEVMTREMQKRAASDNPVRFVLTVGDNIYADINFGIAAARSGNQDAHWEAKFFRPYQALIRSVPFYPSLGNHDGNGTENRDDLSVYLDNFFFPGNKPARWYTFTYADFAQFFALDSTDNTDNGPTAPIYNEDGAEFSWMKQVIPASRVPWKIPYFHHPIYNAGPRHGSSYRDLEHFVHLFEQSGVRVVFSGHEHNFQFTEQSPATGNIEYIVSGAGGELRTGDVKRKMGDQHIAGWSAQRHFLLVEMVDKTMRVTPLSYEAVTVKDRNNKQVSMPFTVRLP